MPSERADILVAGAGSRIAQALAQRLDGAAFVSRRPSDLSHVLPVDRYDDIPAEYFAGVRCVVNCIGITDGEPALLDRVNSRVPGRMAVVAKAAGVRHFIHISSFSVYGRASVIEADTALSPASAYGLSKLKADDILLALADDRFAVTILRLPLIYGKGSLGKLGRMLRLWTRTRFFPVPAADVRRSMIASELAADVVARLSEQAYTGVALAADPEPFTYRNAAAARPERLHRMILPQWMTRLLRAYLPAIGDRLFADSWLADADNRAIAYGLRSQIYNDIAHADLR